MIKVKDDTEFGNATIQIGQPSLEVVDEQPINPSKKALKFLKRLKFFEEQKKMEEEFLFNKKFDSIFHEHQTGLARPNYELDSASCYPGSKVWLVWAGKNKNSNDKYKVCMVNTANNREVYVVWGYSNKKHRPSEEKQFNLGTAKKIAARFARQLQPLVALGVLTEDDDELLRSYYVQKVQKKEGQEGN